MKIKYSPCKSSHDTQINVTAENTITIDGEYYEFDDSVIWPDIAEQTGGKILEAHREIIEESGHETLGALEELEYVIDVPAHLELFVTVRRFYTGSCSSWDTGMYHEVTP